MATEYLEAVHIRFCVAKLISGRGEIEDVLPEHSSTGCSVAFSSGELEQLRMIVDNITSLVARIEGRAERPDSSPSSWVVP